MYYFFYRVLKILDPERKLKKKTIKNTQQDTNNVKMQKACVKFYCEYDVK